MPFTLCSCYLHIVPKPCTNLCCFRNGYKAELAFSQESKAARFQSFVEQSYNGGEYQAIEDILREVDSITVSDVSRVSVALCRSHVGAFDTSVVFVINSENL